MLLTNTLPAMEGALWRLQQLEEVYEGGFSLARQFLQCRIDLLKVGKLGSLMGGGHRRRLLCLGFIARVVTMMDRLVFVLILLVQ